MATLCALTLASCAQSGITNDPPAISVPAACSKGGGVTPWPTGDLKRKEAGPLLDKMRRSEVSNARAARACQQYLRGIAAKNK